MEESFWERKTAFWKDKELGHPRAATTPEVEPGPSRRARRLGARSKRRRRAAPYAAAAVMALVVAAYGLRSSDVPRDGSREAGAADGAQSGSVESQSESPVVDAVPVASVTDTPPGVVAASSASPTSGLAAAPAPAGATGGATNGAPAPSGSLSTAPAPAPAPLAAPVTTSPTAPLPAPAPPPSCTIGLLGTCIIGGGDILP